MSIFSWFRREQLKVVPPNLKDASLADGSLKMVWSMEVKPYLHRGLYIKHCPKKGDLIIRAQTGGCMGHCIASEIRLMATGRVKECGSKGFEEPAFETIDEHGRLNFIVGRYTWKFVDYHGWIELN